MKAPGKDRLLSLDVLRGITIIGMILVNYADTLAHLGYTVFPLLLHAKWAGFHIADSLFPAFVFMTGVSIPLARSKGVVNWESLRPVCTRTLRLIIIGLFISNLGWIFSPDSETFRPEGVLQRIAVAYFFASILYMCVSWKSRLFIAALLLIVYWPLCMIPSPDGIPTDFLTAGANFSSWVDRAIFGTHVYVKAPIAFDPEGLLGMLPAIAQALLGVAAGEWVISRKGTLPLLGGGMAMVAVGLGWSLAFPIVKAMWSSSFVLLSTGIATTCLAVLYWLLDICKKRIPGSGFCTDFGVNSIFAYCLHESIESILAAPIFKKIYVCLIPAFGEKISALAPSILVLLLIWVLLNYMHKKSWFVKV